MADRLIRTLIKLIRRFLFIEVSFSQEGEDRILYRLFEGQKKGFYIDIGANHPRRFSNTYLFYLMGWSGICIDPNSDFISTYARIRPRDVFINIGVSDLPGKLVFFKYNDDALNTFDAKLTEWRLKNTPYKIVETQQIELLPLHKILENQQVPSRVDIMNIDVEGFDFQVLKSNNWETLRPKVVLVENLRQINNPVDSLLINLGYYLVGKTGNTQIYSLA